MIKTTYIIDARPQLPFHITGNCYQPDPPRDTGRTLVLLHATGLHKETWEPVVETLFELSASAGDAIRDAWAIECPNHGESAVLNETELTKNWADHWDGWAYPRAVHAFLLAKPGGVDFASRNLVVVGHSYGGCAAILLTALTPRLNIETVAMLDGTVSAGGPKRDYMDMVLAQLVWIKPDVWRSRKDAARWFASAPGFKKWDKKIQALFIEHGLKKHYASKFPAPYTFQGVTLACNKSYEAACYRANAHHDEAWERLQQMHAHGPPVHMILSENDEFDGAELKNGLLKGKYGGGAASVQYVERTTHMFAQQRPEPTAHAIWNAISGSAGSNPTAKL
ncbi:alpha/beta hydrolase [Phanerochaete sordida]|uniref:Alpha/beta hydrolase n=1 Tax=Phanerochaete sordida TaxID=48140 RepID=A0A9P3LEP8_9APHY|nr:alpha/beta hydrolase [Phanerochaete sordida]